MDQRGERTQARLLDAAEELFARHGIDAVSDRGIAERAGAANHSAVRYHFGGRDGLIRALLTRGQEHISSREAELRASLPTVPGLRDLLAAQLLPYTEYLATLPVPSWRARFLHQLASIPSGHDALHAVRAGTAAAHPVGVIGTVGAGEGRSLLDGVPPETLKSRSRLVEGLVLGICANFEAQLEAGTARGTWTHVAYFLLDCAHGLLTAPVTRPSDFVLSDQTFTPTP